MFYSPLFGNPNRIKINLKFLLLIILLITVSNTFAQVGIGTNTPAASAALEISSSTNNKGILIPRITATQKDAISNAAEGLMIFQTTAPAGFYYYTSGAWKLIISQTDLASGNAGTASKLASPRNINGVAFDGTADITVTADAGTLSGTTLKSTVTGSSLTSVGTLANLTVSNPIVGSITGNAATATTASAVTTNANLTGPVTSVGNTTAIANGAITNAMLANTAVANLTGTNTGDQTTIFGNAGTATKLASPRDINGVAFDGSGNITVTADAGTLTGTTLKSTVTGSSLTSVGTLANLTVTNPIAGSITGNAATATLASIVTTNANLTGDVTSIGNAATIANNAVTTATIANGAITDEKIIDVAATKITGTLAVANGGTGASTQNFVDLTTDQTIAGTKTFSSNISVNGVSVGIGSGAISSNTAIGGSALSKNTTGSNNTANGVYALVNNTTGSNNSAQGIYALEMNTTGSHNTSNGMYALSSNTIGEYNTSIGLHALSSNTTGSYNTAIGFNANVASGALSNATAIGWGAQVAASNTIQLGNTSVENVKTNGTITAGTVTYPKIDGAAGQVLTANGAGVPTWLTPSAGGIPYTGANGAVNLGAYDLKVNGLTVGRGGGNVDGNTANGSMSLYSNSSGNSNTAYGYASLYSNTTGSSNIANGNQSLYFNTTGSNNTAIGNASLNSNTTGIDNTASGFAALYKNTGGYNTASGSRSLYSNTTGGSNTALGYSAGTTNTTGTNNTALGYAADVASGALSNATAIGAGAIVAGSNTIQLGNTAITAVNTSGTITAAGFSGLATNLTGLQLTTGVTGTLPIANGGTGQTTYTDGQLLIGNTTGNTLTKATLTPGAGISIINTSGAITIASTGGMPSGTIAGEMLYWNGAAWVKVLAGSNGQTLTFIGDKPVWTGSLPANTVVNSTTGKIWMDRNLGATRVAENSTDYLAYGDLYQWGRGKDGHQTIVWISSTASNGVEQSYETASQSSSTNPGTNFLTVAENWYNGTNPDNLWQGVNSINNPCPSGYRLPTSAELDAERLSWSNKDADGAFASPLKLPMAGRRSYSGGSLDAVGSNGYYWSSTVSSANSRNLFFSSSLANMYTSNRAYGFSVRCLKD